MLQPPSLGFVTPDMEIMTCKEEPIAGDGVAHPDVARRLSALYRLTDGRFFVQGMDLSHFVKKTSPYPIGCGASTDVFQGVLQVESTPMVVAIKFFRGIHIDPKIKEAATRRLIRETRAWNLLSHPNIQPYLGYCDNAEIGPSLGLVSPFWINGTILKYLEDKPDVNRFKLVGQIASGIRYLHKENVVHGDLSGNNVLIDDEGNARLADLGRAKVIGEDGYHTDLVAGSVEYMAPELFEEPEHQEEQDEKNAHYVGPPFSMMSDIYAFSMLAFQVFTGKTPLYPLNRQNSALMINAVHGGRRPFRSFDLQDRISDGVWRVMERCWSSDPRKRPTAEVVWVDLGCSSPPLTSHAEL